MEVTHILTAAFIIIAIVSIFLFKKKKENSSGPGGSKPEDIKEDPTKETTK